MVRRHYDAVLEPSRATAWWQIRPQKPKNVVRHEIAA
jgi:hypothetical protein